MRGGSQARLYVRALKAFGSLRQITIGIPIPNNANNNYRPRYAPQRLCLVVHAWRLQSGLLQELHLADDNNEQRGVKKCFGDEAEKRVEQENKNRFAVIIGTDPVRPSAARGVAAAVPDLVHVGHNKKREQKYKRKGDGNHQFGGGVVGGGVGRVRDLDTCARKKRAEKKGGQQRVVQSLFRKDVAAEKPVVEDPITRTKGFERMGPEFFLWLKTASHAVPKTAEGLCSLVYPLCTDSTDVARHGRELGCRDDY